jgi:outer membrane lipoprotein-sorting protein
VITNFVRHLSRTRLALLAVVMVAALATGTALAAGALGGSGDKPPEKPLDQAIQQALTAPEIQGVTANIKFTNRLVDASALQGRANPLITGATGRLWAAADGRLRLELQSDQGDAQITSDGKVVTVYEAGSNTVYRIEIPQGKADSARTEKHSPPTLADIRKALGDLAKSADVSGAIPSNVAGQPAYTVRIGPKHDGGLLGAAEVAWDAATGTPLRAAVYAAGADKPVLELTATDITFGPVAGADLQTTPPADAKVVKVNPPAAKKEGAEAKHEKPVTGADVAKQLTFPLQDPATLVGLPRKEVRLVEVGSDKGALVTYGAGLGGIAVLQEPAASAAPADTPAAPRRRHHGEDQLSLPEISIAPGVSGQELSTALGTVVRFQRNGVQYTVVGSVPASAAEAAARALATG